MPLAANRLILKVASVDATMDRLHRFSFAACTAIAMACGAISAYFFIFASYDTAIPAMALLAFALAFATLAAVISRNSGGERS